MSSNKSIMNPFCLSILGVSILIYATLYYIQKNQVKRILNKFNCFFLENDEKILCYGEYSSQERFWYSIFASVLICGSFSLKEILSDEISMLIMYIIFFIICFFLILLNVYSYGKIVILTNKSLILTSSNSKNFIKDKFKISEISDSDYTIEEVYITKGGVNVPCLKFIVKNKTKQISNYSNLDKINEQILQMIKKNKRIKN